MIHGRTCNLCEAMCGVLVDVEAGAVVSIKGDPDDPLSRGHICPKATALADLYTDADRLKRPLIKRGGDFEECSWEAAFDAVAAGLGAVREKHGNDAVGVYLGNPTIHALGAMTHGQMFYRLLRTRSRFSATSLDQLPHMLAGLEMFGHQLLIPIPDLDRAHTVVVIGANPLASNGSMMSAPGMKQRLRAVQERGGTVIVIDPRKTETAAVADKHLFIRPGTDAALLAGVIKLILDESADRRGHRVLACIDGVADVARAVAGFDVAAVAGARATEMASHWPLAGKTGTVDNNTDAWFIGFDPDITIGIWIGMDDKRKSLGGDEQGAKAALPIWMDIMQAYIAGRPQTDAPPPQFQAPGNIVFMAVDKSTGSIVPQGGAGAMTEAFIAGTEPGGINRAQVP